jgi:peptidyl-tRNA hydrolase
MSDDLVATVAYEIAMNGGNMSGQEAHAAALAALLRAERQKVWEEAAQEALQYKWRVSSAEVIAAALRARAEQEGQP